MRPGAAPARRHGRRPLGPTPRYAVIPRWGLGDRVDSEWRQAPAPAETPTRTGPSAAVVRLTLFLSVLVLSGAALVYVARYVLLIVNRNTLLNSVVAFAANWLGVLASVGAVVALGASGVMLTRWLIARRARCLRALRAAGSAFGPGVVGRLPGAPGQSAVGSGVRHRAGDHRRAPHAAAKADRAVVDRVAFQLRGFDLRDRHQLGHGRPGHSEQHRLDGGCLLARGGDAGRHRPGFRGIRAQAGRTAGASLGRSE